MMIIRWGPWGVSLCGWIRFDSYCDMKGATTPPPPPACSIMYYGSAYHTCYRFSADELKLLFHLERNPLPSKITNLTSNNKLHVGMLHSCSIVLGCGFCSTVSSICHQPFATILLALDENFHIWLPDQIKVHGTPISITHLQKKGGLN